MKKRTKIISCLVLVLIAMSGVVVNAGFQKTQTYSDGVFVDVKKNDWYEEYVKEAYKYGLMKGNSENTFNPDGTLTVAEGITIASRIHSSITGKVIYEEEGEWYNSYVSYAIKNNIMSDGQFTDYGAKIKRRDIAVLLANASGELPSINDISIIPDVSDNADYKDELLKLYNAGILAGNDEFGTFSPESNLKRSEISAMAVRIADSGKRIKTELKRPVGKTVVSETENNEEYAMSENSLCIQSFEDYNGGLFTYGGLSVSDRYQYRKFRSDIDNVDILKAYVETICSPGSDFEIVDKYEFEYKGKITLEYAINYVGKGNMNQSTDMLFKDDVKCSLTMYAMSENNHIEFTVMIPESLEIVDMGYRYGKTALADKFEGPSQDAKIMKTGNFYSTDDGRLFAAKDMAYIVRDGVSYYVDADFVLEEEYLREALKIENYYRDESMWLALPYKSLKTGDIFTHESFEIKNEILQDSDPWHYSDNMKYYVKHDGEWHRPLYNNSAFENLIVKVMYYGNDVAVFYAYSEMASAPHKIEMFAVADLEKARLLEKQAKEQAENQSNSGGSGGTVCSNCRNGKCPKCGGKGTIKRRGTNGAKLDSACDECHGSKKCSRCGGDGVIS